MNAAGFLKQVLPWIGAAATGNVPALASLAIQTVSNVVGKKLGSADDVAAAVAGATPEQLLALKQSELEFQEKCKQFNLQTLEDLERIASEDRENARARQIALKDKVPAWGFFLITFGFFGLLAGNYTHVIPAGNEKVIDIMIGALGTAWVQVVGYYYGSSAAHDALVKTIGGGE